MIRAEETFAGSFPFAPRFSESAGFRMHYVDEGPKDADVVLCLHGEPTWGYLFRHVIAALGGKYRLVVPDHMGFGKSATPGDRSYWLQDHVDNLERLVVALDLRNITLLMHDFGGPVGMGFAARRPDRIARLIFANAPAPFGQADLFARLTANAEVSPWFRWGRGQERTAVSTPCWVTSDSTS
jgi:cis-3-alkyl-4-acyloxetan-2-one decarboxylase